MKYKDLSPEQKEIWKNRKYSILQIYALTHKKPATGEAEELFKRTVVSRLESFQDTTDGDDALQILYEKLLNAPSDKFTMGYVSIILKNLLIDEYRRETRMKKFGFKLISLYEVGDEKVDEDLKEEIEVDSEKDMTQDYHGMKDSFNKWGAVTIKDMWNCNNIDYDTTHELSEKYLTIQNLYDRNKLSREAYVLAMILLKRWEDYFRKYQNLTTATIMEYLDISSYKFYSLVDELKTAV